MGISNSRLSENNIENVRVMSYNVEWGFLNIPDDIKKDSCGHKIPHTKNAQEKHLILISKNIGLILPDICFLQEIGSKSSIEFISNKLKELFGLEYNFYYSNGDEEGYQGVGLLIKSNIVNMCSVDNIPNFKLNRALGITININNLIYKIAGCHLKSLCDQKYEKDVAEQKDQLNSIIKWIDSCENAIICGDFNNIPGSEPIEMIEEYKYSNILDSDKYIDNIIGDKYTEFHGKNGKESGSRIDYIFKTDSINVVSSHIINIERETKNPDENLRGETSDHLPILGIFKL